MSSEARTLLACESLNARELCGRFAQYFRPTKIVSAEFQALLTYSLELNNFAGLSSY
jgi:hypothetical protein